MANDKEKDAESKRPPWRTVSVSTLPKPDKNALLRAKLLDASRRMRAGKCNVGIQTDISPTKILREVNIGIQNDLIIYKDVGILTDGFYTKKRNGSDEYVLTYSVPMMTDAVLVSNASTQTALPKVVCDDFINVYYNWNGNNEILKNEQLNEPEKQLLDQISKIRQLNKYSLSCHEFVRKPSSTENECDKQGQIIPEFPKYNKSTLSSWQFENEDGEKRNSKTSNYEKCTVSAMNRSNQNLVMSLNNSSRNISQWNLLLAAIDELIQESNHLVDIIEKLRKGHNKNIDASGHAAKLNSFSANTLQKPFLPSEYWNPIIEQQESTLTESYKFIENS